MRLPGVLGKIAFGYAIRRLNALSAGFEKIGWGGLTFAGTPLSAITRFN